MKKPHLLHVELRTGLHLRFSCQADSAVANGCGTYEENPEARPEDDDYYEHWLPTDECWVEHHVLECVLEGISISEFLEELGEYGPITGPIPVRVWNEGDFEECIPHMEIWKEMNP
jgi:hypothetical protein